jgi:hypothetical protein
MIFSSATLYMEPGLDHFTVSYKVDLYIVNLIRSHLFTPYGLTEKDEDIDIGVMINVAAKTEKLVVTGPKSLNKGTTIGYDAFFPYHKIKTAPNERVAYIDTYFEVLEIILPQHDIPIRAIEKVKTMVFEELEAHSEEYVYVPAEKPNVDEILKKLGYDAATRTFNLPNGDMQVDP